MLALYVGKLGIRGQWYDNKCYCSYKQYNYWG